MTGAMATLPVQAEPPYGPERHLDGGGNFQRDNHHGGQRDYDRHSYGGYGHAGFGRGYDAGYYRPRPLFYPAAYNAYYYAAPAYYYPSYPVAYIEPPAPPPPETYVDNDSGNYCRQFSQQINVNGELQESYGTACLQPDGSWRVVPP